MRALLRDLKLQWKLLRSGARALELVRGQRASERWPEVQAAVDRLKAAGHSERAAEQRIALVLAQEIRRMIAGARAFDRGAYVDDLKQLG